MDTVSRLDAVSLLGTAHPPKATTQEEFDMRYGFLRRNSARPQLAQQNSAKSQLRRRVCDNWTARYSPRQLFPTLRWIPKYELKREIPKDLVGSLLLALLFIPQGLASGLVSSREPILGCWGLILVQIVYVVFGSSRHSSIGAFGMLSVLASTTEADLQYTMFVAALILFAMHALSTDWILDFLPDQMISGFTIGLYVRLVVILLKDIFPLDPHKCNDFWHMSVVSCVSSVSPHTVILSLVSLSMLLIGKYALDPIFRQKCGPPLPYEIIVMGSSVLVVCLARPEGVATVLSSNATHSLPHLTPPPLTLPPIADAIAIALFSVASHLRITQAVAAEKMHTISRQQELLSFCSLLLPSSLLGLPPLTSQTGETQLNVEGARCSLVANLISAVWMVILLTFSTPLLKYLPICVIACCALLCVPDIGGELRRARQLWTLDKYDCCSLVLSLLLAVLVPNACRALLAAAACSLLTVVLRIQWADDSILVRLADGCYAEDERYDSDLPEFPVRIFRFEGPLVFTNTTRFCERLRDQIDKIKGQVLDIGTRTASLRSNLGPKDSLVHQSKRASGATATNIVICQEPTLIPNDTTHVRILILDMSACHAVDLAGFDAINQMYHELLDLNVRMIFANTSARLRDSFELFGVCETVPKNVFYPTLNDAMAAARQLASHIHMSVSMNGYRDVIALSTACSDHEEERETPDPTREPTIRE